MKRVLKKIAAITTFILVGLTTQAPAMASPGGECRSVVVELRFVGPGQGTTGPGRSFIVIRDIVCS